MPPSRIESPSTHSTLAKRLAPEDLSPGQMVAVHTEIVRLPSFFWCGDAEELKPDELVRIRCESSENGLPLKVMAVCLPYVLLKDPWGDHRTNDTRLTEFVKLNKHYAKAVRKAFRKLSKTRSSL
ncbi:MAG: hypothetical protein KDA80_03095 [Planctomycetaceae bacterium]|nr:hypothetical protein [Planctomycetaceae bacterium]